MGNNLRSYGRVPFRYSVGKFLEKLFDTTSGHDHDGTNSKAVAVGTVADLAVTDAKLAADVKVGSLAALTTTEKTSVVGAINEVDANADAAASAAAAKYTKPAGGIPATDLDAATQAVLDALGLDVRRGTIQLRGTAKTPIAFQDDTAAALTTTVDGSAGLDLSTVGDGGTIIVNPDGAGEDTATLNAAAATSVSGASPSTDISAGADNKFMISVNGSDPQEVELTLAGLNTGAAIAAHMEDCIQALAIVEGLEDYGFEDVTVAYDTVYTITSGQLGTGSSVVITPATLNNCTEELKIGEDAGGTETAGTGDCADITAVTLDELVTLINGDIAGVTASTDDTYITITSDTEGRGSSLVAGNSSLKTLIGLAQGAAAYGAQGLGYATDMAAASYQVALCVTGTAGGSLGAMCLASNTKTTAGFVIEAETAASEAYVDVLVVGAAA